MRHRWNDNMEKGLRQGMSAVDLINRPTHATVRGLVNRVQFDLLSQQRPS